MDWKRLKINNWRPVLSGSSILLFAVGIGLGLLVSIGFTKETAAIYAVIIAAAIGLFAYKWQKNIDRETEIMSERRRAYAGYLSAAMRLYFAQPFAGEDHRSAKFLSICDEELTFYEARNAVYLIAPKKLGEAVWVHDKSMRAWIIKFSEILGKMANSKMANSDGVDAENDKADIRKLSDDERAKFHALLNLMRDDAALQTNLFVPFADLHSGIQRKEPT